MSSDFNAPPLRYITVDEHRQFVSQLNQEVIAICNEDTTLSHVVPLLTSNQKHCSAYDELCSSFLASKTDHLHGRAIRLQLKRLNGDTCDVFVSPNDTIQQLKKAIEICVTMKLQHERSEVSGKSNIFGRIKWNRVWRKYDLWIDRSQRISFDADCSEQLSDTAIR